MLNPVELSELSSEWDYKLNLKPIHRYTKGSNYSAFWICSVGHSFSRAITKGAPIVVTIKTINVDILTNHARTGKRLIVEYDGEYWHREDHPDNITSKDLAKTKLLIKMGYTVIRIRENGLKKLELTHKDLIQLNFKYNRYDISSLIEAIETAIA